MSVTIKHVKMAFKDPVTNEYTAIDAVADRTTSQLVNEIQTTGATYLSEMERVAESIPEDYSTLSDDVDVLKSAFDGMSTATAEDVGKALKAKTVSGGKVTAWEFGDTGTAITIDPTLKIAGAAADAKETGDMLRSQSVEIAKKANSDGYYQDMTVGDAEQLVSSQFVEDNVPYKFRTSGGSADIGNRAYVDKVVGGTIAWNQLWNSSSRTQTVTAGSEAGVLSSTVPFVNNHVYLASIEQKVGLSSASRNTLCFQDTDYHYQSTAQNYSLSAGRKSWVVKSTGDKQNGSIWFWSRTPDVDVTYADPQLFDLTQMFGSTIADYIYSIEQATPGAGVAWFRNLFPKPYYEYNAGEMISVSGLQSHDTIGFNLFDKTTVTHGHFVNSNDISAANADFAHSDYIPVIGGQTYYYPIRYAGVNRFIIYDSSKIMIGRSTEALTTLPREACYVRINMHETDIDSACFNFSWPGTRNGEYKPYEKHSYPLDSSLTLRGIPKLSADNQLYFDGDEYEADGTVTRRCGVYKLTGNEASYTDWNNYVAIKIVNAWPADPKNQSAGVVSSGALAYQINKEWSYFKSSMSAADFKTYVQNNDVYLVYELATPTTETAEPYQGTQIVNDWGTEEYVSGTICPVGHETRYHANLRDKLQHLPDLAGADGYYMIQQTGAQMSLVLFRIPQATGLPDGTYTLKATVSGGTPTYTWEEVTE